MAQVMADASAPQRFSAMLLSAFAAGALLLAAIDSTGCSRLASLSARVRSACDWLSARRGAKYGLVVRQGMTLTLVGLGLGIAGALGATRLMRGPLYQTEPFDLVTFASVPGILAVVALLACYLPARPAAIVEPMTALRGE